MPSETRFPSEHLVNRAGKAEQESTTLNHIDSISIMQGEVHELNSLYINTNRGEVSTLEMDMSPYFNIKLKLDAKVQSELNLAP